MQRKWLSLVLLLALLGCGKTTPAVPKLSPGTRIGNLHSFWTAVLPAYKPGMRWTFRRVLVGSDQLLTSDRLTVEVAEIKQDLATLKITDWVDPATVSVHAPTEAFHSPTASYESLGTEDVTVPYGSFKGAAKFRFDPQYQAQAAEAETILWFVQGIGLVKSADIQQSGGKTTVVTQELTEFKK